MRFAATISVACALFASASSAQTTQTYRYDANGRLLSVTVASGARSGGSFTNYATDPAYNRNARYAEPIPALAATNKVQASERLVPSQSIVSADTRFTFILQTDGNAVIYGPTGPLWSTITYGTQAVVLTMQPDGNLLIWSSSAPVWQTATSGHPSSYLIMQNDGDLVLYDGSTLIWHSNTGGH